MTKCCFCPGCKTGYRSDHVEKKRIGQKVSSMYQAPKDPDLFEKWKRAIPRADRVLKETDFVCALHFRKEDIEDKYEVKLADGTVWKGKKGKSNLKKDAVPCIFPNVPGYISNYATKRKLPTKQNVTLIKIPKIPVDTSTSLTCFCPGCKISCEEDREQSELIGKKIRCMFSPPKDPVMFSLWQKAIPRVDFWGTLKLDHKHVLCEIHFREEDIILGERNEQPTLKPDAIPCYFPNVPDYSNIPVKKKVDKRENLSKKKNRKVQKKAKINEFIENESDEPKEVFLPLKRKDFIANLVNCQPSAIDKDSVPQSGLVTCITTEFPGEAPMQIPQSVLRDNLSIVSQNKDKENLSIQLQLNPLDALSQEAPVNFSQEYSGKPQEIVTDPHLDVISADEPEVLLPQSVLGEQFSFPFIKVNINMIAKQNSMWTINAFDTFIICARWNLDYIVERKIVIKDDLTVKVFLKERPTTIGKDLKLLSLETISQLINRVEKTTICPEICNNEGKCHGFLQGTFICRKRNLCEGCIKWEKDKVVEEKIRLREEKRIAQKRVELIRFHFNV